MAFSGFLKEHDLHMGILDCGSHEKQKEQKQAQKRVGDWITITGWIGFGFERIQMSIQTSKPSVVNSIPYST
jgi:hypothetical protein